MCLPRIRAIFSSQPKKKLIQCQAVAGSQKLQKQSRKLPPPQTHTSHLCKRVGTPPPRRGCIYLLEAENGENHWDRFFMWGSTTLTFVWFGQIINISCYTKEARRGICLTNQFSWWTDRNWDPKKYWKSMDQDQETRNQRGESEMLQGFFGTRL